MSAPRLDQLLVRPGESIPSTFERFRSWARTFQLFKGDPRIRFSVVAGRGTWVHADGERDSFIGFFYVSLSDMSVKVGEGTLNAKKPTIKGVTIDGYDENGEKVDVPSLKIEGEPNEDLESFVCIKIQTNEDGKIDPKNKEALTIVHVNDDESLDKTVKFETLAVLEWDAKGREVRRVQQVVTHNLKHQFSSGYHFVYGV